MREAQLQQAIRLAASEHGHRLFRNNVGTLPDQRGIPIHFGLCVGSSDLIGWTRTGRFAAIEVKGPNARVRPEQVAFVRAVLAAGGCAAVVWSVEEAMACLEAAPASG